MKKLPIGTVLLILSFLAACSSKDNQSKASLAYGGLEMVVSAAGNVTAAPAPFSPMSEPLVMADGVTITTAAIVMEDVRFVTAPGQDLRWKNKNNNKNHPKHWNRGYLGSGPDDSGLMETAELESDPEESLDPDLERGENSEDNDDIQAELEAENGQPKLSGPYYIDLLAGRAYPEFITTAIPAGTYHSLLFRLGDATAENAAALGLDAADPLIGRSLIIEGTFTSGTAAIPFRVLFAEDNQKTYRFDFAEGLEITPDTINTVVMEFDVGAWVTNADLLALYQDGACEAALACTVDAAGVYNFTVSDQSLRDSFRDRFRHSAFCGKDGDGDRKLGNGERNDMEPIPEGTEG